MPKTIFAAALLGSLAGLFPTSQAGSMSSSGCLCTSDQPCWPSPDVFSQLESQLSQPLIYPVPTASPCYPPLDPSGNCTDVQVNWNFDAWRSTHPGSMQSPNYEALMFPNGTLEGCFLNTSITGTCLQGRVPVVGVDARSPTDIQAAIGFAVEHNLKLVVKNSGHDYIGRSNARGSFMVWTHNMKNITYDPSFVPQGAPANETYPAVTLAAGVQWAEAYDAVDEYDRLVVGAGSSTVGSSGGWLAGGGHSPFSPNYGLGVDNSLEISIVLSTGEYLTTNKYQHSDLYWALRGGGGSTYGIVTSVTYLTHPKVSAQTWVYQANVTNSSVMPELVERYVRYQPQFTDAGWGGFGLLFGQGMLFTYYAPNMTNETAATSVEAWHNFTQSLESHGVVAASTTVYSSSWLDPFRQLFIQNAGQNLGYGLLTSRLLTDDDVTNYSSEIANLLIECTSNIILTVFGGKVKDFSADSSGVNPAMRNAVVHPICQWIWNETSTPAEVQATVSKAQNWVQAIHDITPNDGAYLNEASPFEIDFQKTFFGDHYEELKSIKDKYDPYRMFVVQEGVGSEDWNDDLTCRNGSLTDG